MRFSRLVLLAAFALVGTGGNCDSEPREVNLEEWRIRGTYRVVDYLCGSESVTVDSWMEARIVPPNTYDFTFSDDGLRQDIRITGESCAWGGSYTNTYISATEYYSVGVGSITCTPSNAACHDFMILTNNGHDVCGLPNTENTGTWVHTAVPAVGGTYEESFPGDTWCNDHGHTGLLTFRYTRLE